LRLKYDEQLTNFAFKFNLRHHNLVHQLALQWERWETSALSNRVLTDELAVEKRLVTEYKDALKTSEEKVRAR